MDAVVIRSQVLTSFLQSGWLSVPCQWVWVCQHVQRCQDCGGTCMLDVGLTNCPLALDGEGVAVARASAISGPPPLTMSLLLSAIR